MRKLCIFVLSIFLFNSLQAGGSTGDYPAYSGNKRIAIIMLEWKDKACPTNRQTVVDRIWNDYQSLRKYFLAMSRNVMDFTPPADAAADGTVTSSTSSVYGPYKLSIDAGFDKDITYANVESYYGSPGSAYLSGTHSVARDLAAARDGFNANDYDYIMYVTPKGPSTGGVGGYAGVYATYSHLYVFRQNYINHEIGHNLGLAHSNTAVDQNGYGSQDCIMGNQNNPHLDSVHTYNLGWYPDASFSVKSYGQYTIENLAQPNTDNLKVLRFDRGAHGAISNSTYNIWASYRVKGIGHDSGLNNNWNDKVNIHLCRTGSPRPTDSNSRYYYNNNVSKFLVGGTYTDPDNVCKVKFLRKNNSGNASAVVQFIDPNGNQPPSIPANQTVTVSSAVNTFSINTNDPEGNSISYTIVQQPSNGTVNVSGNTFTYTGSTYGIYTFKVRANDGMFDSVDQTVTLQYASPNPPMVNAGPNQTVSLSTATPPPATAGADIYLNAALDDGVNSTWEDSLSNWNLTLDTSPAVTYLADAGSSLPGITAAYSFPGGTSGNGGGSGSSFDSGWDSQPVSIEIWFKPNSTAGDGVSNGQILFETGGGTGLGIFYNDGAIEVGHDSTEVISNYDVSSLAGEFIQVVLTYDETNFKLYVNGVIAANGTRTDTDWSGSDGAGLGTRGGSNTGGRGNGDSGTESFEGKIAIFRAYRNQVLTPVEVMTNFNSVAGGSSANANLDGTVSDPDGDTPTTVWTVVSGPGPVSFGNASSVDTTATFLSTGTYILRLTADDGGNIASDDIVITVNDSGSSPNNAPVAVNGSVTTDQDTAVAVSLSATDTDGDPLSYSIVSGPANGTLSGSGANRTYTPNAGFFGNDSFTFKANDGMDDSNTATVTISVNQVIPPNNAPVAANGSVSTDQDSAVAVSLSATDADGDPLSYSIVSGPANGSLTGSGANRTYTPNPGYFGTDSFTFKANDGTDDSNTATVTITVNEVNEPGPESPVSTVSNLNRLAWFTFDADASDEDNNLSMSFTGAQVSPADVKYGSGALQINSGQKAVIADNAQLNTGGPWSTRTTSIWFKLDSINGRQVVMEEGGSTRGFNIYVDNGTLYVGGWDRNRDGSDVDTWNGTWHNLGTVNAGEWYHVALVLDAAADPTHLSATAFKVYLNGVEAAAGNGMQISAHGDDFGIGALAGGTLYHDGSTSGNADFNGKVDDLAIWNRALEASEIAKLAEVQTETVVAESGTVAVEQPDSTTWFTVNLQHSFTNPVVILGPATINGEQPVAPRVRNVTADSFQFQIAEWEYLDGYHASETISWLVVEAGDHTLADGTRLAAGHNNTGTGFSTVSWNAFSSVPVVFSQVVTANDAKAVTTRQKSVSTSGFQVSLEVEEAGSGHANETVAWVAVSQGSGTLGEAGVTGNSVTHSWYSVNFGTAKSSAPALLANMQTSDGGDTATLRIQNLSSTGFEVQVQEEESKDTELSHTTEIVGYLALASGLITKQASVEEIVSIQESPKASASGSASANSKEVEPVNTEITIGGSGPLSSEEYQQLGTITELLTLNEGTFTVEVTAESGKYTFYITPGAEFDYAIINDTEYSVTYNDRKEIMKLLDILFSDDPILEVKFP